MNSKSAGIITLYASQNFGEFSARLCDADYSSKIGIYT